MNLAGVTDFAKAMAQTIKELYGSTVTIAGTSYTAAVSTGTPELNLESGGFQRPIEYVIRIPKADMATAPALKSAVVVGDRNLRLLSVRQSFNALAQEWILEVGTP